jgi:hypothetical protein
MLHQTQTGSTQISKFEKFDAIQQNLGFNFS